MPTLASLFRRQDNLGFEQNAGLPSYQPPQQPMPQPGGQMAGPPSSSGLSPFHGQQEALQQQMAALDRQEDLYLRGQRPPSAMGMRPPMQMQRPVGPPSAMQGQRPPMPMGGLPQIPGFQGTGQPAVAPMSAPIQPQAGSQGPSQPSRTSPASAMDQPGFERGVQMSQQGSYGLGGGVEQWRDLVAKYFPANEVDRALAVMQMESGGNPAAHNPNGEDSRGLFQINLRAHAGNVGGADMWDPEANVRYAAQLFRDQGWRPWSAARVLGFA